jgi:thioredoxin reductase
VAESSVVVIGGGPAGLATACVLRELGATDVVVLERESQAGGVPRHSDHIGYGIRDLRRLMTGPRYAAAWRERAIAAGVDIRTTSTATHWDDTLVVSVTGRDGRYSIKASAIVLATGCRERPRSARLIPGDRPAGVMTTGQLQQLVHLHHQAPGQRAVIVGAEHVSYSAAMTLAESGCRTVAMVTEHPKHTSFQAFDKSARLRYRFPVLTESLIADIRGQGRVTHVEVRNRATGLTRTFECDTVVFTGDWIADHELASSQGLAIDSASTGVVVDAGFRSDSPGVFAAGNVLHPAETSDVCSSDGHHVARSVVGWLKSQSWPVHRVAVQVSAPLLWVAPGFLTDHQPPPRHRFVLRANTFRRASRLVVSQDDRVLWSGRVPWLIPQRSVHLTSRWLDDVDLGQHAPPVVVRAE